MSDYPSQLRIMPINSSYDCSKFDCGDQTVNAFLRQFTSGSGDSESSPVFAAVDELEFINGFYSLTASNIEFAEIPQNLAEKISAYPVPTIIIDTIAVHKSLQGKGVGSRLLIDALQRIHNAVSDMDVMVVLVEAKNDRLRAFYLHYGFIPLTGSGSRLFLPMDKIEQLFQDTGNGK